jgi:hypothetical protein
MIKIILIIRKKYRYLKLTRDAPWSPKNLGLLSTIGPEP